MSQAELVERFVARLADGLDMPKLLEALHASNHDMGFANFALSHHISQAGEATGVLIHSRPSL